jgi:hypothetical protein
LQVTNPSAVAAVTVKSSSIRRRSVRQASLHELHGCDAEVELRERLVSPWPSFCCLDVGYVAPGGSDLSDHRPRLLRFHAHIICALKAASLRQL